MLDCLIDSALDVVKLIPFLLVAFLIIELIEHKFSKKSKKIVEKSGRLGPLFGSIFGLFPQCGFSVLATNLYVTRIITLGTLISIYLSTSDEMIFILLSSHISTGIIFKIFITKFILGLFFGFIIDFIFGNKQNKIDYHICEEENCHCKDNIILSILKHTLNITIFIFIATFILNVLIDYLNISNIKSFNNLFAPFISSLIGLIPNCAASVILTTIYTKGAITLPVLISGLLTGSGVALLVLFKTNKNIKENLLILAMIYLIGSFTGVILQLICF